LSELMSEHQNNLLTKRTDHHIILIQQRESIERSKTYNSLLIRYEDM